MFFTRVLSENTILPYLMGPISHQVSVIFRIDFQAPPKIILFGTLGRSGAPKSARIEFFGPFWVHLRFRKGPQRSPKSAKWRQTAQKIRCWYPPGGVPGTDLLPRPLPKRSWAPFWLIWGRFLIGLGSILG